MKTRPASPLSILTTSAQPHAWSKPKSQVADVGNRAWDKCGLSLSKGDPFALSQAQRASLEVQPSLRLKWSDSPREARHRVCSREIASSAWLTKAAQRSSLVNVASSVAIEASS